MPPVCLFVCLFFCGMAHYLSPFSCPCSLQGQGFCLCSVISLYPQCQWDLFQPMLQPCLHTARLSCLLGREPEGKKGPHVTEHCGTAQQKSQDRFPSPTESWGCPIWSKPTDLMKTLAAPKSGIVLESDRIQEMNQFTYPGSCI